MNTKHTPGPWIAHEGAIFQEKPHGEVSPLICDTINGRKFTGEERGANARLIAAAPDLLRIVDYLHQFVDAGVTSIPLFGLMEDSETESIGDAIRAAIAKATQSNA